MTAANGIAVRQHNNRGERWLRWLQRRAARFHDWDSASVIPQRSLAYRRTCLSNRRPRPTTPKLAVSVAVKVAVAVEVAVEVDVELKE